MPPERGVCDLENASLGQSIIPAGSEITTEDAERGVQIWDGEKLVWTCDLIDACARYREALEAIRNELGVPGPGYPSPVANAAEIAQEALDA